jgi:hypothetical protein
MTETNEKENFAPAPMDPKEVYRRNVITMSDRQMSSHLRRKTRSKTASPSDAAWAIVLSTIFDSTKTTGGKLESYLW